MLTRLANWLGSLKLCAFIGHTTPFEVPPSRRTQTERASGKTIYGCRRDGCPWRYGVTTQPCDDEQSFYPRSMRAR